jgi:oxygen-independent coproporphyrinogen III oxidase
MSEIGHYRDSQWTENPAETVYFGGGTPSLLTGDEFGDILEPLASVFGISKSAEITVEVNPDDITAAYLQQLKDAGINRLSVGVQTFHPERLRFMNRAHTREEAAESLHLIRDAGFRNWTADLIYGNPGQATDDLAEDIEMLLSFHPPHISAYSLTVEPRTRLGSLVRKNVVIPADDDMVAAHTDVLVRMLAGSGIMRYEVSNFAVQGHEAIHNSAYWNHSDYLGLGPGAHSFRWLPGRTAARRWCNRPHLPGYLEKSPNPADIEELNALQLAEERLMMGLRTREGVTYSELSERYLYPFTGQMLDVVKKLTSNNFLHDEPGRLRLTGAGMQIADRITLEIISSKA